jgi:hypothetical protein
MIENVRSIAILTSFAHRRVAALIAGATCGQQAIAPTAIEPTAVGLERFSITLNRQRSRFSSILRMILSEKSATFRDHVFPLRMILSEKSATFRDHVFPLRMILSEKSATFRDHALRQPRCMAATVNGA